MSLPRSYFQRQLDAALHKSVPISEPAARAASSAPNPDAEQDLTTIDGQSALQHLTNIIASHQAFATATADFHRAGDELQQTSHLLLEAGNLNKSYDHVKNCMKAHAQCHKAFALAKAVHKEKSAAHHATVVKCVKGLAKVLGGGPASTFAESIDSEPSRLDTAKKAAAVNQLCKALRTAGVPVHTRTSPNAGIPNRFGKGWTK